MSIETESRIKLGPNHDDEQGNSVVSLGQMCCYTHSGYPNHSIIENLPPSIQHPPLSSGSRLSFPTIDFVPRSLCFLVSRFSRGSMHLFLHPGPGLVQVWGDPRRWAMLGMPHRPPSCPP